jgi:hypothetical protein
VSVVSILRPILRLPKLLREPGGVPLVEAVAQARSNLDAASAGYLRELEGGLGEITAEAAKMSAFDDASLTAIYQRAGNLIGIASVCGRKSIDDALLSLCDLLDHLRTRETLDSEAINVHLGALRLLLQNPQLEGQAGAQTILDGLHRVSQRFTLETPADAPGAG